ncbi:glycerol-3-phosphate dehydrogenase/oxidase [Pseudogracilibacillus auburnensis]|uniref:glycerol-3-phosphate dehydrogenase/oxidase n=1 Tax=Pseudogracilibacillus auburnensis TaxID=1494959 RepID=UPI001A9645A4|nr:glycerol-3-phosphate dehydrogenase/oxidase [Pseudogracilibacillus auburnensis]MBO1004203.1 glycerol-3-phosphate dehydrogenase/oxidase [Pseudogracilibacillus auburnensis]
MNFSNLNRDEILQKLKTDTFDVLIIGGGITGTGIALDAVTRGLKVALVEMQDFASGTSSRSTKLVHGGLRYLKQFEIKEVAELGRERAVVYENGPHVTTPELMLLPFHKGGTFGKMMTAIGLNMYDILAQVKKSERKKMLTQTEVIEKVPFIKKERLKGGGVYVEYRTDDARLTLEVAKKATEQGATLLNYAEASGFMYDENKKIVGIKVHDHVSDETIVIHAHSFVNAAGPWVDTVRKFDYATNDKHLKLSKGVHIVFSQSVFPLKQAVYFDSPDKRMIFAIPRDGKTYVGTTDDFYEGNPANMDVNEQEVSYLLDAVHYMFPDIQVSEEDVESSWAGVRPLIHEKGKAPSEISRKDEIWEAESGLITMAGGKLTGYRKMAETTVDLLYEKYIDPNKFTHKTCQTKHLPISGGDVGGSEYWSEFKDKSIATLVKFNMHHDEAEELVELYGSNSKYLIGYLQSNETELPNKLYAKLMYAIHHEMVLTPTDFFIRRTGELLFNISDVIINKEAVIEHMSCLFDWTVDEKDNYTKELMEALDVAVHFD